MTQPRCVAGVNCPFRTTGAESCSGFSLVCEHRFYSRGRRLFTQGAPGDGVLATVSGWIKQTFTAPSGRSVSLGIAGPGTLLGLHEAVAGHPYASTAEAVDDSELVYVARAAFLGVLGGDPTHAVDVLRLLSCHAERLFVELCEHRAGVPPLDRLRAVLRDLAARCGSAREAGVLITLPLTVQDLAERIGCSRQWTSELLGELEAEGSIGRKQGRIVVRMGRPVIQLTERRQLDGRRPERTPAESAPTSTHRGRTGKEELWPASIAER